MTNVSLDAAGIFAAVTSHAQTLGIFDRVNGHEAKNAPGTGMTVDVWLAGMRPFPGRSGLAAASALLTLNVRVYNGLLAEPQDGMDPAILTAVATLIGEYVGDLDLGGTVAEVDLLGQSGVQVDATAGYLTINAQQYRVMTIVLPVIVNDVWAEAA